MKQIVMNFYRKASVLIVGSVLLALTVSAFGNDVPKLKIGHVGHDHHLALFVAMDEFSASAKKGGLKLKPIIDKKVYELVDNGQKKAVLEIVRVGGGSKMPTALAQKIIDIGFGGVAPVLAAIDKKAPIKLISPLHYKGDMFVLSPKLAANSWQEFVKFAKNTKKPIRIGYKNPVAVAKVIFEEALTHEGIPFGSSSSDKNAKIHLINVKGGKNLNTSLANGIVDGYVGNNPFPAIGECKKILKVICDLDDLPPGNFKNHPCCCIAAGDKIIKQHPEEIVALLKMFNEATKTINTDLNKSAKIAARWIGTNQPTEIKSIKTSGYSMTPEADWQKNMNVWIKTMKDLGIFKKQFKDKPEKDILAEACELKLVEKAIK